MLFSISGCNLYHEKVLHFVKCFCWVYEDDYVFFKPLLMYYIDWFSDVKLTFHSWINHTWSWYMICFMLLARIASLLSKDFCMCFPKGCWSVVCLWCLCLVLVWEKYWPHRMWHTHTHFGIKFIYLVEFWSQWISMCEWTS